MANIHEYHQALQALTFFEVFAERALPFALHLFRDFRVAIAGQVNQTLAVSHFKQVDKLGAPWGF